MQVTFGDDGSACAAALSRLVGPNMRRERERGFLDLLVLFLPKLVRRKVINGSGGDANVVVSARVGLEVVMMGFFLFIFSFGDSGSRNGLNDELQSSGEKRIEKGR